MLSCQPDFPFKYKYGDQPYFPFKYGYGDFNAVVDSKQTSVIKSTGFARIIPC